MATNCAIPSDVANLVYTCTALFTLCERAHGREETGNNASLLSYLYIITFLEVEEVKLISPPSPI